MKTIANKKVLLTGASGGIGTFIARALAREQATVICVSRSQSGLDKISTDIKAEGGKAVSIAFDICNLSELPSLVKQIHELTGPVDILVNNAGVEKYRPFESYTKEDIESILTTNLLAPMELTRLILSGMLERNSGHIVNIASLAGKKGAPFNSIYSASKAGLIMWSDAIRQELANTNVGVSAVCPGYTDAGMYQALDITAPDGARVAKPTQVADAVLQSIQQNKNEVIVDGFASKFLFAMTQFSPQFGDAIYQKLGVVDLNHKCAQNQMQNGNLVKN